MSEDAVGITGGLNLYEYASNDPVNATDPLGLMPKWKPKMKIEPCFTADQEAYCEAKCATQGGVKTCNMMIVRKLKLAGPTPVKGVTVEVWVDEPIWPPQCTCNREDEPEPFCKRNATTCAVVLVPILILGAIAAGCMGPGGMSQAPAPAMGPPMVPGAPGGGT